LGGRNSYAIVGTELGDGTIDGLLISGVGARGRDAGVQLRDGSLVGAETIPARAGAAGCAIPAVHAVIPGAGWEPCQRGRGEEGSGQCKGLHGV